MATIDSVMTKLRTLLSSLSTKMGTTYSTFTAAINALPSKKTQSNVSVSGKTVTTPAGIYFSQVQGSVSEGELPTPQISVSSKGVVTATVDMVQSGVVGYIPYDSQKSKTYNLTTQVAKTVTPTASSQEAVAAGVYTTGAITVSAVPTEEKTVASSTGAQTVTPTSGKFLSKVTVNAIPTETKTVTPSTGVQNVTPSSGKVLTKVTVNAIPNQKSASDVTVSGTTVTIPAGYYSSQVKKIVSAGSVPTTSIIIDTENVFSDGYGVDVYYTVFENEQISNYHLYVDAFSYIQLSSIVVGSTISFVSDFYLDDSTNMLFGENTQGYQWAYAYVVGESSYFMFWE